MKKERFFGKNGQTAFLGAAVLVLLICYIDNFHGGSAWIPTYFQHVAVNCLIAAILALGLNFVSGYLGQTSLGHAAFYGIGAYTTAVLLKYTNISFWITIPVGFLLAALVSIPLAMASLRVKGQFLIVITYAFCEILRFIAINTAALGGTAGIPGHICIGYIRGTIFDFGIFGLLYEHTQWIYLVLLGAVNFVVFYFVFKWFIVKFGLETPGREEFEVEESASQLLKEKNWPAIAALVVEGLGGKENIVNVENCISRLRVDLKDPKKVDQVKIKDSGCAGIFFPSEKHIHVVFGPHVEFVRHAVDDLLKK